MLSLGTELDFALAIASANVGVPAGSPPPVRAATSTFLMSFANSLPRRASTTAFLCLVVAHLLCPLIWVHSFGSTHLGPLIRIPLIPILLIPIPLIRSHSFGGISLHLPPHHDDK